MQRERNSESIETGKNQMLSNWEIIYTRRYYVYTTKESSLSIVRFAGIFSILFIVMLLAVLFCCCCYIFFSNNNKYSTLQSTMYVICGVCMCVYQNNVKRSVLAIVIHFFWFWYVDFMEPTTEQKQETGGGNWRSEHVRECNSKFWGKQNHNIFQDCGRMHNTHTHTHTYLVEDYILSCKCYKYNIEL